MSILKKYLKSCNLYIYIFFHAFYHYVTRKDYRCYLNLTLRYSGEQPYKKKIIKFQNYIVVTPDCNSFLHQYKNIFVDHDYYFTSNLPPTVIYDCGANIGLSCLYFKKLYPEAKIKAFEADPKLSEILDHNLLKNDIKGVEIINKAVWTNNDGVAFGTEGSDEGSIYRLNNKITVPSIRLKDCLLKENYIDMLKMDIEGAELPVIKDCRDALSHINHIFIEYHSFTVIPQQLHEILQILTENNFRYYFKQVGQHKSPEMHIKNGGFIDFQINIYAWANKTPNQ